MRSVYLVNWYYVLDVRVACPTITYLFESWILTLLTNRHFSSGEDVAMKILRFLVQLFNKIGRSLVSRNIEPQIKPKRDRYGNSYWQVYDFTTINWVFGSEQEVRAWIDHYYHSFSQH